MGEGVSFLFSVSLGRLSFDDIKFISEKDHLQIAERTSVEKGDILMAMIGSISNPVKWLH